MNSEIKLLKMGNVHKKLSNLGLLAELEENRMKETQRWFLSPHVLQWYCHMETT